MVLKKTILLKKVLNQLLLNYLSIYLDISEFGGYKKGELSQEAVLKEMLYKINEVIHGVLRFSKGFKDSIYDFLNNLLLKKYDFNNGGEILNIPISVISDNYEKLSKFVMELPQNIVDENNGIDGFIIVMDEFQLLKNIENPNAFFGLFRSFT